VVACALAGLSTASRAASVAECVLSWTVVPSPVVRGGELFSVAAESPDDAWAVGGPSLVENESPSSALIEHWDGTRWSLASSPSIDADLRSVSAAGPAEAWAVGESTAGYRSGDGSDAFAVAEHWDGKRWRRAPTPGLATLGAVADVPAAGVWAVGTDEHGAAVVVHRAGARWQILLRLPNVELLAVAALSATDLWVGGSDPAGKIPRYLELHWNGRRWSRYSQPSAADDLGAPEVIAIDAADPREVWAAGDVEGPDAEGYAKTVLLRWNGTGWRSVPTPQNEFVSSLAVRTPGDVAVAGVEGDGDAYGTPFLRRRMGRSWQETKLGSGEAVHGLARDQAQGLWGVGFTGASFDDSLGFPHRAHPLIKRGVCL